MKLSTLKESNSVIDLKNKGQVDQLANSIAAKGFPEKFSMLYKTSQGELTLDFELKDRTINEESHEHVIRFDYRLDKTSYEKILALQKKIKNLSDAEDPDGEKYDTLVEETNFDGLYLYGEYTGKPASAWGKLD